MNSNSNSVSKRFERWSVFMLAFLMSSFCSVRPCHALSVLNTDPVVHEREVAYDKSIDVRFDVDVDLSSVTTNTVILVGQQFGRYPITLNWLASNNVIVIPSVPFLYGERVELIISDQILDFEMDSIFPLYVLPLTIETLSCTNFEFIHVGSYGANDSRDVKLGDLDGDSDLDAVEANNGGNTVWRNDGFGVFSDSGQSLSSVTSAGLDLGDVDGDGDLDAVFANIGVNNGVWTNDRTGGFSLHTTIANTVSGHDVTLFDIDANGALDAVFAYSGGATYPYYLNNGSGDFSTVLNLPTPALAIGVMHGDVDNDGQLYLVLANQIPGGAANDIILNGRDVEAADLDDDGDLDAVVADTTENTVWLNGVGGNPKGFFSSAAMFGDAGLGLAAGDVDGDGDVGLYLARSGTNQVYEQEGCNGALDVSKIDSHDPAGVGDTLAYIITLVNTSAVGATGVTLTEVYDPNFIFSAASPMPTTPPDTWDFGTMDPGATQIVTIVGRVAPGTLVGSRLTNTVTVTSTNAPTGVMSETTAVDSNTNQNRLSITKTDNRDPVNPGSNLTYTIIVANPGGNVAGNLTVVDILPPFVTFQSATPAPTLTAPLTFDLRDLGSGASTTIVMNVSVSASAPDGFNLINVAVVNATNATKGELVYSIVVSNLTGGTLTNVIVDETFDGFLLPNSITANPPPTFAPNVWVYPTLGAFASETILVRGVASSNAIVGNQLEVRATSSQSDIVEEFTLIGLPSPPGPGDTVIDIAKVDDVDPAVAGGALTYTIHVRNTGVNPATNVDVTEFFDPLFTFVGANPPPTETSLPGVARWSLGTIAASTDLFITVMGTVSGGATASDVLTNRVSVQADNAADLLRGEDTRVTTNPGLPSLVMVVKNDILDPVLPGEELIYTIDVINGTAGALANVVVDETFDGLLVPGSIVANPAPAIAPNIWTYPTLAPFSTNTIGVRGIVSPDALAGNFIWNQVEVTGDESLGDTAETSTLIGVPGPHSYDCMITNMVVMGSNVLLAWLETNTCNFNILNTRDLITGIWLRVTGLTNIPGTSGSMSAVHTNGAAESNTFYSIEAFRP